MKKIIFWLWQLPQNLLGLLIIKIMSAKKKEYNGYGEYYSCHLFFSGISLGNYIIFDDRIMVSFVDVFHEKGHQKQSLFLGPLYLIIIGIPSLLGNIIHRFIEFNYYELPWEKWANELGGLNY